MFVFYHINSTKNKKTFEKVLTKKSSFDMIIVQGQLKNDDESTHIVLAIWAKSFYKTTVNCLAMGESVSRVPIFLANRL